jgi:NDP-sugar pyrophosphorylase family protein
MKAMILAAGLGTRLRPLTDDRPKALVTVAGRTLLEIALLRLRSFGVSEVIVNTHHYAEMIADYLRAHDSFGMRIEISREEELLETGGGLKRAGAFFTAGGDAEEPFILHNVDVISSIDLGGMVRFHTEGAALATLAVQQRATSRYLLFDEQGQLCGRRTGGSLKAESSLKAGTVHNAAGLDEPRGGKEGKAEWARPATEAQALAFSGIHVISPRIFAKMTEEGAFSIIATYMRLAAQGEKIIAFRADQCYWRDLGRPESILAASQDLAEGRYSIN